MYKKLKEGSAEIYVTIEDKVSRKMSVFYNPVMELNRTISVLILENIPKKNLKICMPLAGSGVRGIRFLKELQKSKIKEIYFNDISEEAIKIIKKNLKLNKLEGNKKIKISCKEANKFMLDSEGFDYVDIDPFGSPNAFLDSAIKRISRGGILAATATDTSALCGTSFKACVRKYWAVPKHGAMMKEIGLRILIRKVQLIAAQYDRALIPIFSYSKDHYMRVFFSVEKGKEKVDKILKKYDKFSDAGPMWLGQLWDKKLVGKIKKNCEIKFVDVINEEAKLDVVGFYNIHTICKKNKIKNLPKTEEILKKIKKKGGKACRTHFDDVGIKSNLSEKDIKNIILILRN